MFWISAKEIKCINSHNCFETERWSLEKNEQRDKVNMNLFMFPFAHGAYDAQELTDDSEVRQTMFKYHLVSFYNTYFLARKFKFIKKYWNTCKGRVRLLMRVFWHLRLFVKVTFSWFKWSKKFKYDPKCLKMTNWALN